MGLGKTVQTLGVMACNTSSDPKERSNLIVAVSFSTIASINVLTSLQNQPLALLAQWKEEIESKMAPGELKVLIHHSNTRARSLKDMQSYDVILTTFQTLSSEWYVYFQRYCSEADSEFYRPDAEAEMKSHGNSDDDQALGFEKPKGPLYLMEWYRVILGKPRCGAPRLIELIHSNADEAQFIRNRRTKMSRAVAGLNALFRWVN